MARHSKLATLASLLVIVVAAAFFDYLAVSRGGERGGYPLSANFTAADGIARGSDVSIAGIQVGRVVAVSLDPQTMLSHVVFHVNDAVHLPADSSIAIRSTGLTTPNQLVITPGKEAKVLAAGATITRTRDYVSLETAIGQYIFGGEPDADAEQ